MEVIIITGVSGSGKSWVCSRRAIGWHHIAGDKARSSVADVIRNCGYSRVICDVTIGGSKLAKELGAKLVIIDEDEQTVAERLKRRRSQKSPDVRRMIKLRAKPCDFRGTAEDVLKWICGSHKTHVYALTDPRNGNVRYVGKSNNPKVRLTNHLARSKTEKSHKAAWLRQLISAGLRPQLHILETVTMYGWTEAEMFWVSYLKFLGCNLVNESGGGDGLSFVGPSLRRKLSRARQGHKLSADTRRKISLAHKGVRKSEAHRIAAGLGNLGKKRTTVAKRKMSLAKKGIKYVDYEYKIQRPDGVIDTTNNLTDYAKQHKLNTPHLSSRRASRGYAVVSKTRLKRTYHENS